MSTRRRCGKIARLAKEQRDLVNAWLRDGVTYEEIGRRLAERGVHDVNGQNLTNWKEGGFQEWLEEEARIDDMRIKREFALQVVRENEGSQIHEAGLQIAASQIYELLTEFDVASLKDKLDGDPQNYSRIVNALSKLSDSGLKYERYKAEVAAAKARIEKEIASARTTGGLTTETLGKIEQELRLL